MTATAGPEREHARKAVVDFLGIGAQKAGTTWLHRMLGAHPEVFIAESDDKDLRFFSCYYDFGYRWYEQHFHSGNDVRRMGEFSTSYFYSKEAPERVRRYNSNMHLLLSLRNPVDRLISHHKHEIRIGHIKGDLSLARAIEANPSYIEQSLYFTQLSRWLEHFPLSRFHVIIFEEFFRDPVAGMRGLYDFLAVDSSFVPEGLNEPINPSRLPRSRFIDQCVRLISSKLRSLRLGWTVDALKSTGMRDALTSDKKLSDDVMGIDAALRDRLYSEFVSENDRLSALLGRDLSVWSPGA